MDMGAGSSSDDNPANVAQPALAQPVRVPYLLQGWVAQTSTQVCSRRTEQLACERWAWKSSSST
eukprot:8134838-Pyramimonas_sp.AAC.1